MKKLFLIQLVGCIVLEILAFIFFASVNWKIAAGYGCIWMGELMAKDIICTILTGFSAGRAAARKESE